MSQKLTINVFLFIFVSSEFKSYSVIGRFLNSFNFNSGVRLKDSVYYIDRQIRRKTLEAISLFNLIGF